MSFYCVMNVNVTYSHDTRRENKESIKPFWFFNRRPTTHLAGREVVFKIIMDNIHCNMLGVGCIYKHIYIYHKTTSEPRYLTSLYGLCSSLLHYWDWSAIITYFMAACLSSLQSWICAHCRQWRAAIQYVVITVHSLL